MARETRSCAFPRGTHSQHHASSLRSRRESGWSWVSVLTQRQSEETYGLNVLEAFWRLLGPGSADFRHVDCPRASKGEYGGDVKAGEVVLWVAVEDKVTEEGEMRRVAEEWQTRFTSATRVGIPRGGHASSDATPDLPLFLRRLSLFQPSACPLSLSLATLSSPTPHPPLALRSSSCSQNKLRSSDNHRAPILPFYALAPPSNLSI